MASNRARVTELVASLRHAAALQDPLARAAIELVRLVGDDHKDSLVTNTGDDMLRAQGAARAFVKLHHDLTTTPPSI